MTPNDLVARLRMAVVEENAAMYRQLFTCTLIEKATDPYWIRALNFFNGLSTEQQEVFFEVIRQVAIDTASNILGVIDGVNSLEDLDEEFVLTGANGSRLSGDLQSLFLGAEEQATRK